MILVNCVGSEAGSAFLCSPYCPLMVVYSLDSSILSRSSGEFWACTLRSNRASELQRSVFAVSQLVAPWISVYNKEKG